MKTLITILFFIAGILLILYIIQQCDKGLKAPPVQSPMRTTKKVILETTQETTTVKRIIIRDIKYQINSKEDSSIEAEVNIKTNAPDGTKVHVQYSYLYYEGNVINGKGQVTIKGWVPPDSSPIVSLYDGAKILASARIP